MLPGWQWSLAVHTQGCPPGRVSAVCHTTPHTEPGLGRPHYFLPDQVTAGSPACQPHSGLTHCCRPSTTPDGGRVDIHHKGLAEGKKTCN